MYPSSRAYRPSKPGMLSTCGALSLLSVAPVPTGPPPCSASPHRRALPPRTHPFGSPAQSLVTRFVRTLVQSCGEAVEGKPGRNAREVLVEEGLHIAHAAGRFKIGRASCRER